MAASGQPIQGEELKDLEDLNLQDSHLPPPIQRVMDPGTITEVQSPVIGEVIDHLHGKATLR